MKSGLVPFKKRINTFLSGAILLSLIVGFICISFIHLTPVHADMGAMNHDRQTTTLDGCCGATSDHMELWKSTFVGIPQGLQDLLVLIVLVVTATFAFADFFAKPRPDRNILFYRYLLYSREHPNILTYSHLRLAFSRGILHPKTF
jgi:hypothetical protein